MNFFFRSLIFCFIDNVKPHPEKPKVKDSFSCYDVYQLSTSPTIETYLRDEASFDWHLLEQFNQNASICLNFALSFVLCLLDVYKTKAPFILMHVKTHSNRQTQNQQLPCIYASMFKIMYSVDISMSFDLCEDLILQYKIYSDLNFYQFVHFHFQHYSSPLIMHGRI